MLVFLISPNAGGERGYRVFKKLKWRLLRTKTRYRVYVTDGIDEIRQFVAKFTEVPDNKKLTLATMGGGGMLNEVLNGIWFSERFRFGLIPVGRDSDFARGLKLPVTPFGCLKRILVSHEEWSLDCGVVEFGENEPLHHRSLVGCGVGFDAEWLSGPYTSEQRRGRHSRLFWLGTRRREGLHTLLRTCCIQGYFEVDSGQRVELGYLFLLSVQLRPTEAGGICLVSQVSLSNSQLTVSVLNTQGRLQQVGFLLLSRRLQPEVYVGTRVHRRWESHLYLDETLSFHTDGEERRSRQKFTMCCVHRQMRFLC